MHIQPVRVPVPQKAAALFARVVALERMRRSRRAANEAAEARGRQVLAPHGGAYVWFLDPLKDMQTLHGCYKHRPLTEVEMALGVCPACLDKDGASFVQRLLGQCAKVDPQESKASSPYSEASRSGQRLQTVLGGLCVR